MSRRTRKVLSEMVRGVEVALAEVPDYQDLGFVLLVSDPVDGTFSAARSPDTDERDVRQMLLDVVDEITHGKRRMDA